LRRPSDSLLFWGGENLSVCRHAFFAWFSISRKEIKPRFPISGPDKREDGSQIRSEDRLLAHE
jgi:hypothetical protein